ncbi:kinesin-like protein KIF12 isoform X2 [Brienomyrus brachyistius]|uniref:kinesin-like protein KIF12 isoform X2 n=1 Tax=Brienomyrus brachyistius TaxID=42636 RepID=UPI0020B30D79|nr:kinesin-like protein KIF12 isoform X2 [Brienomyrus brachyistius]
MGPQDEARVIVAARVRPMSEQEDARGEQGTMYCPDQRHLLVCHGGREKAFSFDVVLGPQSSQQDVFEECGIKKLIDMAIVGFSCTVFAFGQTGSGKTYTITGPHSRFLGSSQEPQMYGLMQRSVSYLLDQTQSMDGDVSLSASYLEIYNEQVWDLLTPWLTSSLSVRGNQTHGFYVENLSTVEFGSLEDFMKLLEAGLRSRRTSSQAQNEHSSRSHSILTVSIGAKAANGDEGTATMGKLCLVDLAGSERLRGPSSSEDLLEEAANINRSLLSLGKCISALVDPKKKSGHIPYRDSKLTKLLSDSLGGAGITLMIACVSPATANLQETLNTLRYSSRAKRIKNRPIAKQVLHEKLVVGLQGEIRLLRRENMLLRQHLSSVEESARRSSVPVAVRYGSSDPLGKVETDHLAEGSSCSSACLKDLLQEVMQENRKLQVEKGALLNHIQSSKQQGALLSLEKAQLLHKLDELQRVISGTAHATCCCSGPSLCGQVARCSLQCLHHQLPMAVISPLHRRRALVALPPLRALQAVACGEKYPAQTEIQSEPPSQSAGLHGRRSSGTESRGHVQHFPALRDSRALWGQPVEPQSCRSPIEVLPSAPPISALSKGATTR